jgi:hypothetical protein
MLSQVSTNQTGQVSHRPSERAVSENKTRSPSNPQQGIDGPDKRNREHAAVDISQRPQQTVALPPSGCPFAPFMSGGSVSTGTVQPQPQVETHGFIATAGMGLNSVRNSVASAAHALCNAASGYMASWRSGANSFVPLKFDGADKWPTPAPSATPREAQLLNQVVALIEEHAQGLYESVLKRSHQAGLSH